VKTLNSNPPLATPKHLGRSAIIYVRQSTRHSIGSDVEINRQIAFARHHGWADHLIGVINEDIGKSGCSGADRSGWQRLLKQIVAGQVGAVFVTHQSRLTRQITELHQFETLASDNGVLLHVDSGFVDLKAGRN
jgi:DNA invertase Pin-like site-specific DNA recombinase